MDVLVIALALVLIGIVAVAANELGVDSRDGFHPEPTGLG